MKSDRAGGLPSPKSALTALALLAPVPTIGVAAAMYAVPGTVGQAVFVAAKIWMLAFPAFWYLVVERGAFSWSPPRRGGLGAGAAVGLLMAAVILIVYWSGLATIDPLLLRRAADEMDLGRPVLYVVGAAYWILVNSLIEEYVYRWFILRQLRVLLSHPSAVIGSAVIFTVHHTVAMAVYLSPWNNALATVGVFLAGACWSWLYLRYRSVWPPWIAHVVADIAIFFIGWLLIFG